MNKLQLSAVLFALSILPAVVVADEGMWPLNALPLDELRSRYQFEPSPEWIERVQKSCVRISSGGSGSFVSPHGLVMTNHHVGSDAIADLSTSERDLMRDGFYAKTLAEELRCPHLELFQLMSIRDVTAEVEGAVRPEMPPAEAQAARRRQMSAIEQAAKAESGLHPEIVTLYHGARYHLYQYKKYDDVRLVMAPEQGIAFFGGDLDNFEYPRYDLDCCFLRAYEGGQPAKTTPHLSWSASGAAEGELVFIAGHPARTRRMYTMDHLAFLRDVDLPLTLASYNQREVALQQFVAEGDEHHRTGMEDLFSIQNGRKALGGIYQGLLNPEILQRKSAREAALRQFVTSDPQRQAQYGSAWQELSTALKGIESTYPAYYLMESRRASLCRLFTIARHLVRAAAERPKPDGDRLEEYRDAELSSLEAALFSTAPIHDDLEQLRMADGLTRVARLLGADHPAAVQMLGGRAPADRAAELLSGTKLRDVDYRRQLYQGGAAAIEHCDDPMIRFARMLDPLARELRKAYEDQLESIQTQAYGRIARAAFAMHGERIYPDATYTLRLSIGTVRGYRALGADVPPMTKLAGAYQHAEAHHHKPPFQLPQRWIDRKEALDLNTPFNFVSTNDIIGGNSGSPVFNRNAEVVGLVFDGNIYSLIWDIEFDEQQARAVSVHSQAMIEALRKLYDAGTLADELTGAGSPG